MGFDTDVLRAELRLRVFDTIAWCLPRADVNRPQECLRSEALRPHLFNESRYDSIHDVVWARHLNLEPDRRIEVFPFTPGEELVHESRASLPAALGGGRLLAWYRDLTIDDGVGEACTGGYLDESDMAPWDTWLVYVGGSEDAAAAAGYLVSWVPPQFVECVDEAIQANAYDALLWLDGSELMLARILREERVLAPR